MGIGARLKEEYAQLQKALENSESQREVLKAEKVSLNQEKNNLLLQLQGVSGPPPCSLHLVFGYVPLFNKQC